MGIDALGANLTTMVTGRPEAGEENALDGNSCNPIGFTGIHQESRKPEALSANSDPGRKPLRSGVRPLRRHR